MTIDTASFTPVASFAGGVLIGLSASMMLVLVGRVAGVSGILGGCLGFLRGDLGWRIAFLAGLLAGGAALELAAPGAIEFALDRSLPALVVAGLAVGVGTRLGSGCTSGHGVCGLSRGSLRSLVATLVFMATGIATATIITHWLGGRV